MPYRTCARILALLAIISCYLAAQTPPASTQPPDKPADAAPAAPSVWSLGGMNFSGLVDVYADKALNNPASRVNLYRNFDVRANQLTLNMAKFTIDYDPDPIGFKLDFGFGRAFDIFNATEPGGPDFMKILPQAYISAKPKGWGGFQVDFGKFYTSAGAELTETHLNWNYSRALAYANGPYYHFGVRTSKPVGNDVTVGFQLVNGWNNVEDNNTGKTMGFTAGVVKKKFSWFNNFYSGPEKTNNNQGWRNFYDTVLLFTPTDRLNAYVNIDYGNERMGGGSSADWLALAFAAKIGLTDKQSLAPRYEYYYDKDGFITGTRQKLKEFTITYEYRWLKGLLTKLEYRRDWSNEPVFERGAIPASYKNQQTFLVGVVAFFGPRSLN